MLLCFDDAVHVHIPRDVTPHDTARATASNQEIIMTLMCLKTLMSSNIRTDTMQAVKWHHFTPASRVARGTGVTQTRAIPERKARHQTAACEATAHHS